MKRFKLLDDEPKPQGKRVQFIETVQVKCEHCGGRFEVAEERVAFVRPHCDEVNYK